MTRTDIYKASKSIFPGLADEETFAMDMQDTEKANRAFQSALNNKDKYDEMGVTLPDTVEEFQAIVTTDPKKKSTDTGSNGSQKTQQSSGSKPAQSSQQGPKVFQPQRVFNSAEEIDNYFGYLDQYKNDPNAQKEKQWFDQNYPTISEQFYNQGGKPLTVQGPVYEEQKEASFKYDPGTLPKLQQKSIINNADLKDKSIGESSTDEYTIDPKTGKKIWKRLTDEELLGDVIENTQQKQDVMQIPVNIQQVAVDSEKKAKREEEAAKTKGMTFQQIEEQYKQDLEEIDKKELYRKNYDFIESMIDNQFGGRSNDIDFKKLNVLNKSEVENAYGLLEQDYLEYLQKTDPQEYERVNNEITAIKGKKSDERSLGEREVLENYRVQAMRMHNLLNGYVMTKLEKDYDIKGFYGGINVINSQVEAIDKQLEEMNIDPSGRGVTQPMMDKYNELVQKRNKLVSQVASLAEKTGVTPEIQAKYEDALGRYTDSKITTSQLRSLDSEVMKQKEENMIANKKRFDEAMSGDYSVVGEFARGYAGTVGKSFVDFIGSTWDIAGEAWGDTDYDIFDQMSNFVKGYTLQKQETFGTAQDMAFIGDPKKYEDLPLIYRLNNLTSSGLASISLAASGSLATGALGLGSTVGGGLLMMGSTLADNYEEALSMGYSGQEAAEFASSIAAAEYMVESFFPDFNLFKVPQARNTFFQALKKTNSIKEALAVTFEQLPKSLKYQAKKSADNFFTEGVIEEGGAQGLTDLIKTGFNEKNQDKGQFETFQSQDYLDTVVGGWLGAEGARVVGRLAKPFMPHEESAFYQAAINPQILQLAQSNEVEFSDEVQEIVDEFAVINNAMKSKPGWDNMTDDEKAHVVSEVRRMKYLESKNKEIGIDDPGSKEEISNIKAAVEQYIDQARNNPKFKLPQYALQESSTEEVLPRQQGATTETGGQPEGMGQSIQGEVVAQEGQEVSQEGVKKEDVVNQPFGELPENTEDFTGIGAGYLKNNLWASKQLGKDSKTSLLGNVKNEVLNKGKKAFLYFIDPKLSEGQLDTENKYNTKLNDKINAQGNKTLSGAENAAIENEVGAELAKEGVKGELVSDEKDGTYRIFDTKNTELLGYIEATPELIEKISDPNISEEQAKQILFDEAGVKMGDNVLIHANENDITKYKPQEQKGPVNKKEDLINKPFGKLPVIDSSFMEAGAGVGQGYLPHNIWTNKELDRKSDTGLFGNIKSQFEKYNKDKVNLYFLDPKLSNKDLAEAEENEVKFGKIQNEANEESNSDDVLKDFDGNGYKAFNNLVNNKLAKAADEGLRVSSFGKGGYRIHDSKNTDLVGYLEVTPELMERISDPNISEEEANAILKKEAGVPVDKEVFIHINENDLSKYKTQKDVESEDYVGKLEEAKKQKPEKFWSVSTPPVGAVKGGTIIKVKGGEALVDNTGDIRGLYKYPDTEERGVGDQLVKKGIEAGGVKLDNFALDNLMDIYQRNGFRVVSRMPFSEKDAPEGWNKKKHGTPDVVAMVYDPENKLDIEERQFTKDQYDEAIAYRDSFVDAQKEAYGEQKPSQDEEAKRKSIADIIRGLKSKGGKLYSAGLGIPAAIWDGAVEIIASAVEAGEGLVSGINKAKKYLQDKLKDRYNEDLVDELLDNVINQSPVEIQSKSLKGDKVKANPEGHNLSFVKPQDLIDIESLIKDIESKNEKVWFWVADQLGRGIYADKTTGNEHFLDAGPSYALDPKNRENGIIWASGMPSAKIGENIKNSDYIFIISGSPTQSKLFNKAVFKLFQDKLGDYKKFKNEVLNAKTTKGIREVLNAHNSWETLIEDPSTDNPKLKKVGTGRKKFLIELINAFDKPNSGLHQILKSKDALLDINSIRDGFYADNNFDVNDIMLVLKPEKLGGKSEHSTYENDILGEVIGVPDKKIDAYNILPNSLRKESDTNKTLQTSRVAPYGSGIREVSATEAIERETKSKAEAIRSNKINDAVEMLSDAQETGGSEVTKTQKEVTEKLGEEGKKIAEIDRNFDKLADDLGFIKTCII